MTRGQLAAQSGCNSETIRYYEKIGLMPDPTRTAAGYRIYNEAHLRRLSFIMRLRALGFTLKEVRGLLGLVDSHAYTCGEVHAITIEHLAIVRQKLADLEKMERSLDKLAAKCTGDNVPECPIIDDLYPRAA
jgi:MerR family mercuric resistance operon transcriptional regulator